MKPRKYWYAALVVLFAVGCGRGESAGVPESEEWSLDRRSWNLGAIAAMAEMVDYGVKKRLEDQGAYHGEARTDIARRFGRLLSYPEAHIELELIR